MEFQYFPHLWVKYGVVPIEAASDLEELIAAKVRDEVSAAVLLRQLIAQGRRAGLQLFLQTEFPKGTVKETDKLYAAVRALEKVAGVYATPAAGAYDRGRLLSIF